ncbi:MAG: glycosyltransferase family 4 protein, partial [Candidatus Binatia bacterium]
KQAPVLTPTNTPPARPLHLVYVLDYPELSGGVKVVLQHANLLVARGYHVTVLGKGRKPAWMRYDGHYVNYQYGLPRSLAADLAIITFWTTAETVKRLNVSSVAHFCQGYEGDFSHLADVRPAIEAVYRTNYPTLVVAPHLATLVHERFGREGYTVPPPLDPLFRPTVAVRPRKEPWVVITGIFESEIKGVRTALAAVRYLRQRGIACRVLRISSFPLSAAEQALLVPDQYLCRVRPSIVADHLRRADLLLFPSQAMEGFGLPLLEAMASGVPVVASNIPSAHFIGNGAIPLVPPEDATAFADAAQALLCDPLQWIRASRQGYDAALRFRPECISVQLERGITWAHAQATKGTH